MIRFAKAALVLLTCVFFFSCNYQRADPKPDLWYPLDFETETPIRSLYAGPYELNLVTDDEFMRVGIDGSVVERRAIDLPFYFFGRPIIGQYTFVRLVRGQVFIPNPPFGDSVVSKPLMEVHLVKNPSRDEIYKIELEDVDPGENLSFEQFARFSGAFNEDESQFLLVTLNNTSTANTVHSLYLMDINVNAQKDRINSVSVNRRIDIDLVADTRLVSNVKFINGFFYLCSEYGMWRINPNNGTAAQPFTTWIKDVFQAEGRIYVTGFNDFDFYVSSDNGETFSPMGEASGLKFVEVENGTVFSQDFLGTAWKLTPDLLETELMSVNKDFNDDGALYWNVKYFYDRYYISAQKQLFHSEEVVPE